MTKDQIKIGKAVKYSGFDFTIIEIHTGVLDGMVSIRSRSGTACVSISELKGV